jgi:type 2 lantibiotic biosynthesis protein LanM
VETTSLAAHDLLAAWQDALTETAFPTRLPAVGWIASLTSANEVEHTDAGATLAGQEPHGHEGLALAFGTSCLSRIAPGSEAWLRWLAARASALHERLDAPWLSGGTPADERTLEARLERWMKYVAVAATREDFLRFLRWEGRSDADIQRGLGSVYLAEAIPLPVWCRTLSESLSHTNFEDATAGRDPEHPLPFEEIYLPFVRIFGHRMQTISKVGLVLAPQAQNDLSRSLLVAVTRIASDALYAEFYSFRLNGLTPLAPFVYRRTDAMYRRFVAEMKSGGLALFYQRFPVLARMLAMLTDLVIEATSEFLDRLATDLPKICKMWGCRQLGSVVTISPALSDMQRGGRRVMGITFANGLRLIYKPTDLGIDIAYNTFLTWLNDHGAPVDLRPLRVLDFGTHGWIEYVTADSCADRAAVECYYRRTGALVCLVYLLQGIDCHAGNVIAAGEHPVLVDCETLLNPQPRTEAAPEDRWRVRTDRLIRDSVLSSILLPQLRASIPDGEVSSPCGFCDASEERSEHRVRWKWINTDRMVAVSELDQPKPGHNVPRLAGVPARLVDHIEQLIAGFAATYHFLMAQRVSLLAADGPLTPFRGRFVRIVLRSTQVYSTILQEAVRPRCLHDGVDYSLNFELLARSLLAFSERPVHWPALQAERQALLRHEVPFFGARTDEMSLLLENGERIENYFDCPSYDAMLTKLRNLNEQDLEFQVGLIRAAIAVYADLQAREAAATAAVPT